MKKLLFVALLLVASTAYAQDGYIELLRSDIRTEKIAVITDITQRYLESFSDMDNLVGEYEYLAASLPADGLLILNFDNNRVRSIKKSARCKIASFGFNADALWQAKQDHPRALQHAQRALKLSQKSKDHDQTQKIESWLSKHRQ